VTREYEGKVVVVTGGAQGIGYAISRAYLDEGAYVCVLDVDEEALRELKEIDFRDYGDRVMYIKCDLAPLTIKRGQKGLSHNSETLTIYSILQGE